jgi:peptidoglycan/xylan/chitin deacetylase (PgdA/CDA1 family)
MRAALPAALIATLVVASSSFAASGRPVAILAYHHVAAAPHGAANPALWVRPALFRRQVRALGRAGYRAVTLQRVWRSWHGGAALPAHPVVLSFDDGYTSQYRRAAVALRARGWPGVLNLQVGRLGRPGGLSRRQVRRMIKDGWELDAHSVTHPDLTKVGPGRLASEVAGSRRTIRSAFGVDASFFAYPYGRHDAKVRRAVRAAGFLGATTVHRGLASPRRDPFALDRITVAGQTSPRALLAALG